MAMYHDKCADTAVPPRICEADERGRIDCSNNAVLWPGHQVVCLQLILRADLEDPEFLMRDRESALYHQMAYFPVTRSGIMGIFQIKCTDHFTDRRNLKHSGYINWQL